MTRIVHEASYPHWCRKYGFIHVAPGTIIQCEACEQHWIRTGLNEPDARISSDHGFKRIGARRARRIMNRAEKRDG